MGRRRGGAGDRLVGDVAQVLQGQAARGELVVERGQRDAGLHRDVAAAGSWCEHLAVAGQVDQVAVGAGDGGERVAGADAPSPALPPAAAAARCDQLGLGGRPADLGGRTALVARPVRPRRRGPSCSRLRTLAVGLPSPRTRLRSYRSHGPLDARSPSADASIGHTMPMVKFRTGAASAATSRIVAGMGGKGGGGGGRRHRRPDRRVLMQLLGGGGGGGSSVVTDIFSQMRMGGQGTLGPVDPAHEPLVEVMSEALDRHPGVLGDRCRASGSRLRGRTLVLFTAGVSTGAAATPRPTSGPSTARPTEGLHRPVVLQGARLPLRRAGRLRPGLRPRPRARAPRAEPGRHQRVGPAAAERRATGQTRCRSASSSRPTATPACGASSPRSGGIHRAR